MRLLTFCKKTTALFLCASLLLSDGSLYAAATATPSQELAFRLPKTFAEVQESFRGTSGKTIFYLQDAHDSLEAQRNIARSIRFLVEKYGVRTVFEEGYEGPVPTARYFGFMKDAAARKKVSDFLLDKLRIGGAEYAHINRAHDFRLIGADDLAKYKKNLAAYRESARHQNEVERDLRAISALVEALVQRDFPKPLKDWLKLRDRHEAGQADLLDYVRRAVKMAENPAGAPHLALLAEAPESSEAAAELAAVEPRAIFEELGTLEQAIAAPFLKTPRDLELFRYREALHLLLRLNRRDVTSSEYEASQQTLADLDTQKLAGFLARETGKSLALSRAWEKSLRTASLFYETALERDGAVEAALSKFLREPGENAAVLVYGGFHKDNILAILKKLGVSYQVAAPAIPAPDPVHENYYRQLMTLGSLAYERPFMAAGAAAKATRAPSSFVEPFGEAVIGGLYRAASRNPRVSAELLDRVLETSGKSELRRLDDFKLKRLTYIDLEGAEMDELLGIYQHIRESMEASGYEALEEFGDDSRFLHVVESLKETSYGITNGEGNLVGFVLNNPYPAAGDAYLGIELIGIDPEYQREGFGRRLLAMSQVLGRKLGKKALAIDVDPQNLPMIRLALGFGFHFVDRNWRRRRYAGMIKNIPPLNGHDSKAGRAELRTGADAPVQPNIPRAERAELRRLNEAHTAAVVSISDLDDDETDGLLGVYQGIRENMLRQGFEPYQEFQDDEMFVSEMERLEEASFAVTDQDGNMAGFILNDPEPDVGEQYLEVELMGVDPGQRRQGHALQLLAASQSLARRWGKTALWLEVEASNTSAIRLYKGFGFKTAGRGEESGYIVMKKYLRHHAHGQREDRFRAELRSIYEPWLLKLAADARVGVRDFESTGKGFLKMTAQPFADGVVAAFPADARGKVFVAGSGQGLFEVKLAKERPGLSIFGVEYDLGLLGDSQRIAAKAQEQKIINPGQVIFQGGDFNGAEFGARIAEADYVYYYDGGTKKPDDLAETLIRSMKPGARLIVFGSQRWEPDFVDALRRSGSFKLETDDRPVYVLLREDQPWKTENRAELRSGVPQWLEELMREKGIALRADESTEAGILVPTAGQAAAQVISAVPEKTKLNIFAAGSGQGIFELQLAKERPDAEIFGVEYHLGALGESQALAEEAEKRNLIKPGQVQFAGGNFNKPDFAGRIAQADIVYYFDQGTKFPEEFAETLQRSMKAGARLIVLAAGSREPHLLDALRRSLAFETESAAHPVYVLRRLEAEGDAAQGRALLRQWMKNAPALLERPALGAVVALPPAGTKLDADPARHELMMTALVERLVEIYRGNFPDASPEERTPEHWRKQLEDPDLRLLLKVDTQGRIEGMLVAQNWGVERPTLMLKTVAVTFEEQLKKKGAMLLDAFLREVHAAGLAADIWWLTNFRVISLYKTYLSRRGIPFRFDDYNKFEVSVKDLRDFVKSSRFPPPKQPGDVEARLAKRVQIWEKTYTLAHVVRALEHRSGQWRLGPAMFEELGEEDKVLVLAALSGETRRRLDFNLLIQESWDDAIAQAGGDAGKALTARENGAALRKLLSTQVFEVGKRFDATGIENGFDDLAQIMLEGKVRSDHHGSLIGHAQFGDTASGLHGPLYVVFKKRTADETWRERDNHLYYLVPEWSDARAYVILLQKAAARHLILPELAASIAQKIITYRQFVDRNSELRSADRRLSLEEILGPEHVQIMDRFFAEGYWIELEGAGRERKVLVHHRDPSKFRAYQEPPGKYSLVEAENGTAQLSGIYPGLPQNTQFGRIFIALSLLMLYGDREARKIFEIHAIQSKTLAGSLQKLGAFGTASIYPAAAHGAYADVAIRGSVPLIDEAGAAEIRRRNDRNKSAGEQQHPELRGLEEVRAYLDSRPHAVWYASYDEAGQESVEYVNPAFAKIFGTTAEDILAKKTYAAINPPGAPIDKYKADDRKAMKRGLFAAREGEPAVTVVKIKMGKGVLGMFTPAASKGKLSFKNLEPELAETLREFNYTSGTFLTRREKKMIEHSYHNGFLRQGDVPSRPLWLFGEHEAVMPFVASQFGESEVPVVAPELYRDKRVLVAPGYGNLPFLVRMLGAREVVAVDSDPVTIAWQKLKWKTGGRDAMQWLFTYEHSGSIPRMHHRGTWYARLNRPQAADVMTGLSFYTDNVLKPLGRGKFDLIVTPYLFGFPGGLDMEELANQALDNFRESLAEGGRILILPGKIESAQIAESRSKDIFQHYQEWLEGLKAKGWDVQYSEAYPFYDFSQGNVQGRYAILTPPKSELRAAQTALELKGFDDRAPLWAFLMAFGIDPARARVKPLEDKWGRVEVAQDAVFGVPAGKPLQDAVYESAMGIFGEREIEPLLEKNGHSKETALNYLYLLTYENKPAALVWAIPGAPFSPIPFYSFTVQSQASFWQSPGGGQAQTFADARLEEFIRRHHKKDYGKNPVLQGGIPLDAANNGIRGIPWLQLREFKNGVVLPTVFTLDHDSTQDLWTFVQRVESLGIVSLAGKTVSEVGAGAGWLGAQAASRGAQAALYDLTLIKAASAWLTAKRNGVADNVSSFRSKDASILPPSDLYLWNIPDFSNQAPDLSKGGPMTQNDNIDVNNRVRPEDVEKVFREVRAKAKPDSLFAVRINTKDKSAFRHLARAAGWEIHPRELDIDTKDLAGGLYFVLQPSRPEPKDIRAVLRQAKSVEDYAGLGRMVDVEEVLRLLPLEEERQALGSALFEVSKTAFEMDVDEDFVPVPLVSDASARRFFFVDDTGSITGYVKFRVKEGEAFLDDIETLKITDRKPGRGQILMNYALRQMRKEGFGRVILYPTEKAMPFYDTYAQARGLVFGLVDPLHDRYKFFIDFSGAPDTALQKIVLKESGHPELRAVPDETLASMLSAAFEQAFLGHQAFLAPEDERRFEAMPDIEVGEEEEFPRFPFRFNGPDTVRVSRSFLQMLQNPAGAGLMPGPEWLRETASVIEKRRANPLSEYVYNTVFMEALNAWRRATGREVPEMEIIEIDPGQFPPSEPAGQRKVPASEDLVSGVDAMVARVNKLAAEAAAEIGSGTVTAYYDGSEAGAVRVRGGKVPEGMTLGWKTALFVGEEIAGSGQTDRLPEADEFLRVTREGSAIKVELVKSELRSTNGESETEIETYELKRRSAPEDDFAKVTLFKDASGVIQEAYLTFAERKVEAVVKQKTVQAKEVRWIKMDIEKKQAVNFVRLKNAKNEVIETRQFPHKDLQPDYFADIQDAVLALSDQIDELKARRVDGDDQSPEALSLEESLQALVHVRRLVGNVFRAAPAPDFVSITLGPHREIKVRLIQDEAAGELRAVFPFSEEPEHHEQHQFVITINPHAQPAVAIHMYVRRVHEGELIDALDVRPGPGEPAHADTGFSFEDPEAEEDQDYELSMSDIQMALEDWFESLPAEQQTPFLRERIFETLASLFKESEDAAPSRTLAEHAALYAPAFELMSAAGRKEQIVRELRLIGNRAKALSARAKKYEWLENLSLVAFLLSVRLEEASVNFTSRHPEILEVTVGFFEQFGEVFPALTEDSTLLGRLSKNPGQEYELLIQLAEVLRNELRAEDLDEGTLHKWIKGNYVGDLAAWIRDPNAAPEVRLDRARRYLIGAGLIPHHGAVLSAVAAETGQHVENYVYRMNEEIFDRLETMAREKKGYVPGVIYFNDEGLLRNFSAPLAALPEVHSELAQRFFGVEGIKLLREVLPPQSEEHWWNTLGTLENPEGMRQWILDTLVPSLREANRRKFRPELRSAKSETAEADFEASVRKFASLVRRDTILALGENPDDEKSMLECPMCAMATPLINNLAAEFFKNDPAVKVESWGGLVRQAGSEGQANPPSFFHFWTEIEREGKRFYVSVMDGQMGVREWALGPNVTELPAGDGKYEFLKSSGWRIVMAEKQDMMRIYRFVARLSNLQHFEDAGSPLHSAEAVRDHLGRMASLLIKEGIFQGKTELRTARNKALDAVGKKSLEQFAMPAAVFLEARELVQLTPAQSSRQWEEILTLVSLHKGLDVYITGTDRYPLSNLKLPKLQKLLAEHSDRLHLGLHDRANLAKKKIFIQASFISGGTAKDTEKLLASLKQSYGIRQAVYALDYAQAGALRAFLGIAESFKEAELIRQIGEAYAVRGPNGRWQIAQTYLNSVWTEMQNRYAVAWSA
ncbi:MAG TPA: GNAT family N-acetyltransferase [Verrucomicrobiae bacterium]|nr:GNAT family N-acetyltransferase [Verrucomicrobiae bacterium]